MALDWTNLNDFITDSPGAVWDEDHAQELKDNIDSVAAAVEIVTGTFAGSGGVAVTLTDKGDTDYGVMITILGTGSGDVGEISVVRNSATQMTVYNAGSNTTAQFVATVFASGS